MRLKPVIRIVGGRWDWQPAESGSCFGPGSRNFAACKWCMIRNIKERR